MTHRSTVEDSTVHELLRIESNTAPEICPGVKILVSSNRNENSEVEVDRTLFQAQVWCPGVVVCVSLRAELSQICCTESRVDEDPQFYWSFH